MARPKKTVKAKEPVRIRFKELKNGNKSIYLDIYRDGKAHIRVPETLHRPGTRSGEPCIE